MNTKEWTPGFLPPRFEGAEAGSRGSQRDKEEAGLTGYAINERLVTLDAIRVPRNDGDQETEMLNYLF